MNEVLPTLGKPIKHWTKGVLFEEEAQKQLIGLASLPFIYKHIAVMPDVHAGRGSTIGTVLPTIKAIIPAAVGVDIGCGMIAMKTNLVASNLPDNLHSLRHQLERTIPHGSKPGTKIGQWNDTPDFVYDTWRNNLGAGFKTLCDKYPRLAKSNNVNHLGTLGGGNHFIELCLDEHDSVWMMLHSGSRGVGNLIGRHFIELAKKEMERFFINLPDKDMAYLPEGSMYFKDYIEAVHWAQCYALLNRSIMMDYFLAILERELGLSIDITAEKAINCHHNYVSIENHFGQNVYITRKGAVSAREGELGIIPGSMGAKSYIVRGLGNQESFHSCSHGAGRVMSRTAIKKIITLDEHKAALKGVECNDSLHTLDESPAAYKDIDSVMAAQSDLVEIVATLKQVLCVKG